MTKLRVATAQFELRAELTLSGFLSHVEEVVDAGARAGAELVVLPEMLTAGLVASVRDAQALTVSQLGRVYCDLLPSVHDAYVAHSAALATRKGLWIVTGTNWRKREDGSIANTACLAHPDGRIECQDKLHLTPNEAAAGVVPGDALLVTEIGGIRSAIQICADIEFPELARHLATTAGVELILCPSLTWNRRGAQRVRYGAHARSLENQLFVATSTLVGSCGIPLDGAMHCTGQAVITCPIDRIFGRNDGVLAVARPDDERVTAADLDFDLIAESRMNPEPPGLASIRPDLYAHLASNQEIETR